MLTTKAYKQAYTPSTIKNSLLLNTFYLKRILCIFYPICLKKDQVNVQALLNSNSELNAMILAYAARLSFKVQTINVGA